MEGHEEGTASDDLVAEFKRNLRVLMSRLQDF